MKWKKKLSELNLTEETVSSGIKKKIKNFNTIQSGIDELKSEIDNEEDDDRINELQGELDDLQEALEAADDTLVRNIEMYNKNKDTYDNLAKKMAEGREKKKAGTSSTEAPKKSAAVVEPKPVVAEEGKKVETKKSNVGWYVFGAAVLLITVGAVNVFKQE